MHRYNAVSGGALIIGALSAVMLVLIDPTGSADSPSNALELAKGSPTRWFAMSVLLVICSLGFLLGAPCLLSLTWRRSRRLATVGVLLYCFGAVGLTGFAALLLILRSLARHDAVTPDGVTLALSDTGPHIMMYLWVGSLLLGTTLIAVALLRARSTPRWVPWALLFNIAVQLTMPLSGPMMEKVGMVAFALGITGLAISGANVAAPTALRDDPGHARHI